MNQFPLITISGEPFERGLQHGTQLAAEIEKAVDFYRSIFGLAEDEILRHAEYFRKKIDAFDQSFVEEMDGIARGADIDPLWIVALNARTEILSRSPGVTNECTAVYFSEASILGQNWDWGRALEPLAVLMKIEPADGHAIFMFTEPGIIGKIGMNSRGLGVCLNILTLGHVLDGLPIHILLRAILECESLAQVESLLISHGGGKASNIMVADGGGNGFDVEFCDASSYRVEPRSNYLLHTNHYLGSAINSEQNPDFSSSYARFDRATQFLLDNSGRDVGAMRDLLSDESDRSYPIYREYLADDSVHELGTVCTIVMELAQLKLHIRKGKGAQARFFEYNLDD